MTTEQWSSNSTYKKYHSMNVCLPCLLDKVIRQSDHVLVDIVVAMQNDMTGTATTSPLTMTMLKTLSDGRTSCISFMHKNVGHQ